MQRVSDERLAELRRLREAAQPGAWTVKPSCVGPAWGFDVPELEGAAYRDSRFGRKADAEFIVAAGREMTDLLADLRDARVAVREHWPGLTADAHARLFALCQAAGVDCDGKWLSECACEAMERLTAELAALRAAGRDPAGGA